MTFFREHDNKRHSIHCGPNVCNAIDEMIFCNITAVENPYTLTRKFIIEGLNFTDTLQAGQNYKDTFLTLLGTYRNVKFNNTEPIVQLYCDKVNRIIVNYDTSIKEDYIYTPGRILSFVMTSTLFLAIMIFLTQTLLTISTKISQSVRTIIILFSAFFSLAITAQIIMFASDIYAMTWLDVMYGTLIGLILSFYILHVDGLYNKFETAKTTPENLQEFSIESDDEDLPANEQNSNEKKKHPKEIELNEKESLRKRQNDEHYSEVEL